MTLMKLALLVTAKFALETVATASPIVSSASKKRPTGFFSFATTVIKTASAIDANNQECKIQGGRWPINKFRRVPPATDATAAISAIPP